jgi:type VI secretion system protein ImpI
MRYLSMAVISYHRFTADVEENKIFSGSDGDAACTIGRSEQCSWCLPDPERVISSQHAHIELKQDNFYLFNTSTNGVFVNHNVTPLQKDTPYLISDGDIVAIGDYEIEVSLVSGAPASLTALDSVVVQTNPAKPPVPVNNVDFGIPLAQIPPLMTTKSLDSTLNAAIGDSFELPQTGSFESTSVIPEGWDSQFCPAPVETTHRSQGTSKRPHAVPKLQPSPLKPIAESLVDNECLSAFLEGLGISAEQISPDNQTLWWQQLGMITKDSLNGIMDSLHKRSEFKESSRINQTTFRRNENNPLKFSSNIEDVIHNLLERKSAGFLPPERAVKEAFSDLERHEAGLLAGIEGVVSGLMKLLDPKLIESKGNRSNGLLGRFHSLDNHQNWNQYRRIYSELLSELNDNGKAFYFEDFSKAYEARLKKT